MVGGGCERRRRRCRRASVEGERWGGGSPASHRAPFPPPHGCFTIIRSRIIVLFFLHHPGQTKWRSRPAQQGRWAACRKEWRRRCGACCFVPRQCGFAYFHPILHPPVLLHGAFRREHISVSGRLAARCNINMWAGFGSIVGVLHALQNLWQHLMRTGALLDAPGTEGTPNLPRASGAPLLISAPQLARKIGACDPRSALCIAVLGCCFSRAAGCGDVRHGTTRSRCCSLSSERGGRRWEELGEIERVCASSGPAAACTLAAGAAARPPQQQWSHHSPRAVSHGVDIARVTAAPPVAAACGRCLWPVPGAARLRPGEACCAGRQSQHAAPSRGACIHASSLLAGAAGLIRTSAGGVLLGRRPAAAAAP